MEAQPTEATTSRWDDAGASLVEYALLLALIAVVCIGALSFFGGTSSGSVNSSADSIIVAGG